MSSTPEIVRICGSDVNNACPYLLGYLKFCSICCWAKRSVIPAK